MPFIRYTTKKILINVALLYTLVPMVKTYVETGVISELVIKCVRWAIARQGAFYIYGNFFEKFFDFSIFPGKMTVHATKGAVECFRERLSGGREVISLEADKAGIFESIVEKVIVGGYDEDGNKDPYKVTFIYKTGFKNEIGNAKERFGKSTGIGDKVKKMCSDISDEIKGVCSDVSVNTCGDGLPFVPTQTGHDN